MTLNQRIALLVQLGEYLISGDEFFHAVMHRTQYNNGWLTIENCKRAAKNIAQNYLQKEQLDYLVAQYPIPDTPKYKRIGIVLAENVPLIGLPDVLAVFL